MSIINLLNEQKQDIHIYGQLIHNGTVLAQLRDRGIYCIDSLEELDPAKKLIIRTHGIPLEEEELLKEKGTDYADATCPLVKKLHKIIGEIEPGSTRLVIVGDKNHPEIIAARSYTPEATIIGCAAEADALPFSDSITVIAQTTLDTENFRRITEILAHKTARLKVFNTICEATKVRQKAAAKLAKKVDCMLVIGGHNSSNTRKLYQIALKENKNTFHIEGSSAIDSPGFINQIKHFQTVGITAGASTPPEEIEIVKNKLINISVKEMNHG